MPPPTDTLDPTTLASTINYDLNMFLVGEEITGKLLAQQTIYIGGSVPLDQTEWGKRSKARRLAENIAKLLGPLL